MSTDSTYEMLGADSCNAALPQNAIVREVRFGRFITFVAASNPPHKGLSSAVRQLVLPLHVINPFVAAASGQPSRGGAVLAELELPSGESGNARRTTMVHVDNVAEVVATRRVKVGEEQVEVSLNGDAIASLTYGRPVVVPLVGSKDRVAVRLDPNGAVDARPIPLPTTHVINRVADFLAMPSVQSVDGTAVAVKLSPTQVNDLLNDRTTQVAVNGQHVTLVPRAAASKISPISATSKADRESGFLAARSLTIAISTPAPSDGTTVPAIAPPNVSVRAIDTGSVGSTRAPDPPPLGVYVPYLQTWTLLGYSRGTLINTISLSPQEDTTIEFFTWDRRTSSLEQTSTSEVEQSIESTENTKDTAQVVSELTRDSHFQVDTNVHAQVNVQAVTAGGNVTVGIGGHATDIAKRTTDFIHDNTQKAAQRVRASRQSKVSESHEFGSEQRTTRKIKNINMCHALNLDYFEVLVNYQIATTCLRQQAQLVTLLDLPEPYQWTRTTVRRFEPILKAALIDRSYVAGFDACRLLASRDEAFKAVCERCHCADQGSMPVATDSVEFADLQQAAWAILSTVQALAGYDDTSIPISAFQSTAPPPALIGQNNDPNGLASGINRWLFLQHIQKSADAVWTGLLSLVARGVPADGTGITNQVVGGIHAITGATVTQGPMAQLMTLDDQSRQALHDRLHGIGFPIYKDVQQGDLQTIENVVSLTIPMFDPAGIIAGAILHLTGNVAQAAVQELATEMAIAAIDARYGINKLDDMGLIGEIALFADAYTAWQDADANILKKSDEVAAALDKLANDRDDEIRAAYPLQTVSDAREREDALLMHLKDNNGYYAFAVYQALLSSGAAKVPDLVSQSGGLISPNPMGMVQGKLAFPIILDDAPAGVDPATVDVLTKWLDSSIRQNTALDDSPPVNTVSLPTPGITLETRLGSCDACEDYIEQSREIDLRKRTAEARQAEAEADRLEKRLALASPNLDDPISTRNEPSLRVNLQQTTTPTPSP